MDKYEYKLKTGQMLELMEDGAFNKAAEIADSIDWKRVRNTKMLTDVSDIYEKNGDYQKSYEVLNIAYHRAEGSRKIVYRLCTLALKTKNVDEAIDYYDDFQQIAPKDPNKFILRYQILRAQRAPIEQQIEALEAFKKAEYIEEWAYELAKRYQEAGMTAECLEECDDLILWFNEGKYVYQAMELKMQYKPLTPSQQEKYDNRYSRMSSETMEMPDVLEYKKEKDAAEKEENVEEMLAEAEGISEEADVQPAQESAKRESKSRKIGSTMKLDEAIKSLLNLGMGEDDKVKDSSSEPVSTDVIFEEDRFQGAIEEIESIADLKLVDEISGQKGLRELKVDPDLEELLPDPFMDDAFEPDSEGSGHIEPVTTIMQPIRKANAGIPEETVKPEEPKQTEEKTLEELYADVGVPLEKESADTRETQVPGSGDTDTLQTEPGGDTRIIDKDTLNTIAGIGGEPAGAYGEQGAEAGSPAVETEEAKASAAESEENPGAAAGMDETAGGAIAELDEEARKIIAELDEEARRTIEELDEEEEMPLEVQYAGTAKAAAEHRDQVEGQMNLLDLMADMDDAQEEYGDRRIVSGDSPGTLGIQIEEVAEPREAAYASGNGSTGSGKSKAGEPILPLDIQRMIDEIEGVIPVEETAPAAEEKETVQEPEPSGQEPETTENMGAIAENLRVDESSEWFEDYDDVLDEDEYGEGLPADAEGGLGAEEFTEDIEIRFGGDEEAADEYDEEAEFGEISGEEAGGRFTIEYHEDSDPGYEDEYAGEEPEYAGEYEPEYAEYTEEESGYAGEYEPEETEYTEEEPEYAGEYEPEEAEYTEEEPEYAGEYESAEMPYEETEPEYAGEYESAEPVYEEAEPQFEEYESAEPVYGESGPEYGEEYESAEPVYEEEESRFEEYEPGETAYMEEEPEYAGDYEYAEAGYDESEPVYGEEEPEYAGDYEDVGEEYEDGGYEAEDGVYAEAYEEDSQEYEDGYEEYADAYGDEESAYEDGYGDEGYEDDPDYEAEYAGEDEFEYADEEEEYYEYEDGDEEYYEEDEAEYDVASVEANLEHEFRPQKGSRRRYDEREVPDEEEEVDILSRSTPLSRKETAKLIATGKTSPLPMDEISDALSMSDTGFVVHGRYDLKTQSGIGTRAGLTEEQKKLFSYFVPVRGMSEQLVDVLEQDKNCTNRRGTSNTGNLLIIGNKGNGKTVLAVDVVKAIQKQRNIRQGRVAIVTGDSLNKKKISDIFSKLYGGALIIEKAGKMNEKTVARVNKAMERDTGELLIVLEDQRKPLDRLLTSNREFRRKFTSRLEVPILINDELVTFGQTYAQENGYQIDEMGILALYSRIDMLQREDHAVTIAEVKEVMDEAMEHSQKASAKKLVKRVLGKNRDDSDRIILTEKDFI
ncbi:hypothetical protein [Schaedlerella arabinosiphila]|uniref:hypothetical protein n=1 Tax=Schaedlerella arabinosiphila TaxID=2044587 RepID=UPI0015D5B5D7|nr:hypothetical protein [Schaedlerella arabinosiphila]